VHRSTYCCVWRRIRIDKMAVSILSASVLSFLLVLLTAHTEGSLSYNHSDVVYCHKLIVFRLTAANCNLIEIKKYILFVSCWSQYRCVLLLCTGQRPDTRPRPPSILSCARPNCTNDICRENGLVCCGDCEKLDYAPLQVCQCCPQVIINTMCPYATFY